jgi:ElaB/YqjD/DUF883 family membrane-anchored ribosome-binding protein
MNKSTTTSRAAKAAHNVIDETAAKAEPVELQIREKAAVAGEKAEATQEKAREQLDQSLAKAERFVKEKPLASAGIAFAAGIVVSALLRR